MNVLFVSSANRYDDISPLIKGQGLSLQKEGVKIEHFTIKGRGLWGYLRNINRLKTFVKQVKPNIVHAHYGLSGMLATLSGVRLIVTSLMGSEARLGLFIRLIIKILYLTSWDQTIVKSSRLKNELGLRKSIIIPNGINFDLFKPIDRKTARAQLGFTEDKYVLFVSDPGRKEKNYKLAEQAVELLNSPDVRLQTVYKEPHLRIPLYMYAADALIMTSLWEGSPNVIKEAMFCGLPLVSTDVGDVREIIGSTAGCYICEFEASDVAVKLRTVLDFNGRTEGRDRVKRLDDKIVAQKLLETYNKAMNA